MQQVLISSSEGRKTLPSLLQEVDEMGKVFVFTLHGKRKAALIDIDLLDQIIENIEFGVSEVELLRRSKEKRIGLNALKQEFNV